MSIIRPALAHGLILFNKYSLSLYVYTRGMLGCLLGFWPRGQTHFLLFPQILFVLVSPGGMLGYLLAPRGLASGPKPCGGKCI